MFTRSLGFVVLLFGAVGASAQHVGDLIFGAMAGQVRIVEPTTILTHPPVKRLTYRPPTDTRPADFVGDQGFDYWFLPHTEITEVREARLIAHYVTPGLVIRDAFHTYFTPGASRSSFLLRGSARHKHFALAVANVSRPTNYVFRFQLIDAIDVFGAPLAPSPIYRVTYRAMPPALDASGGVTVTAVGSPYTPPDRDGRGGFASVPEPATLVGLAGGIAVLLRRRARRG